MCVCTVQVGGLLIPEWMYANEGAQLPSGRCGLHIEKQEPTSAT